MRRAFDAVGGLADVGGAEVERVAGGEDVDGVEILAAECFDATRSRLGRKIARDVNVLLSLFRVTKRNKA